MQEYEIQINGLPHTVLLDDETAAKAGLSPIVRAKARKPENKQVQPQNKEANGDDSGSASSSRKRH